MTEYFNTYKDVDPRMGTMMSVETDNLQPILDSFGGLDTECLCHPVDRVVDNTVFIRMDYITVA